MRALIVGDPGARGALAGARGLAAAGWEVGVGGPPPTPLAATSRAAARWHRLPLPQAGGGAFVGAVGDAVRRCGYDVILAAGDAEVLALTDAADRVGAIVPHAPAAAVRRALDKLELTRAAEACGLSVPRTWESLSAARAATSDRLVIKPRLPPEVAEPRPPAGIATSPGEEAALVATIEASSAKPILQEVVSGYLMALCMVVDDSADVLASVQQRADALWPPSAGVSARAHTVPVDPRLVASAHELLSRLGWVGLAQLQFIVPPDGTPRLIDLNGRLYGSLALAIAAGANLPAIWAAAATGRPLPAARVTAGVRYQWLEGDVRNALARPSGRTRAVLAGLARAPRAHHSVWRRDDPLPALRALLRLVTRALRRSRSRAAASS